MPLLEAPTEYFESSPEQSLGPEFGPVQLPAQFLAPPGPAALAQVRIQTPTQPPPTPPVNAIVLQRNQRNLRRIDSFDRDLPTLEEDNHFPAFVHLLPVVLPQQVPEPTLDELLRRVTERNDLENVETVRLRVISYSVSLARLSLFLPRLQHLDLSGSVLSSLRDLGYGLLNLTQLNVSNCGLNSFDGTSGLPAIRVLLADGNMIQRVGPLAELPLLQRLSARNNRISELGLLSFLGMCPNLTDLDLVGNPVCHLRLYRSTLQRSVPTLQQLDGQSLQNNATAAPPNNETRATTSTDTNTNVDEDELSSLSSELYTELSDNPRPATAPHHNQHENNNSTTISLRPATGLTAAVTSRRASITSNNSSPVVGSVLGLVRRQRRRSGHAWVSSSSGSSSSSANSSLNSTRPPSVASYSSSKSSNDDNSMDMQSALMGPQNKYD